MSEQILISRHDTEVNILDDYDGIVSVSCSTVELAAELQKSLAEAFQLAGAKVECKST